MTSGLRQWPVALTVLSVFSLPLSLYWWNHERHHASVIKEQVTQANGMVSLSSQVRSHIESWQSSRRASSDALALLQGAQEDPKFWQSRDISFENQSMSRTEADQYLSELFNSDRSAFLPSVVYLRVVTGKGSLFVQDQGQDAPGSLIVTVKGKLHTRGSGN